MLYKLFNRINYLILKIALSDKIYKRFEAPIYTYRVFVRPYITFHIIIECYAWTFNRHVRWKYILKPILSEMYLFFNDYLRWKRHNELIYHPTRSNFFKEYYEFPTLPSYDSFIQIRKSGYLFDNLLKSIKFFLNFLTTKIPSLGNFPHLNGVFIMLIDISVLTISGLIIWFCWKFTKWYFTPPKKWSITPMFNISLKFKYRLILTAFWVSFSIFVFIIILKTLYT